MKPLVNIPNTVSIAAAFPLKAQIPCEDHPCPDCHQLQRNQIPGLRGANQDKIMSKKLLLSAALFTSLLTPSLADSIKLGDLVIMHPTLRATAPGAKVGAGYVTITNNGTSSDRLVGGEADFAGRVELHEMKMENQVMKMKPLANGVEIPAGATVRMKPGGDHIMFMMLKGALVEGKSQKAKLVFEKAGEKELTFKVKSIADTMKMKHNH